VGEVVSSKMDKSVIIETVRKTPHRVFKKYVKKTKKFVAHDPENKCNVGDKVEIVETRPLSKTKRWKVVSILSQAGS
jgi:small subunit ribosomal protein S17